MYKFLHQSRWAILWAICSPTHLVTLTQTKQENGSAETSFEIIAVST
jgi:hypothetical protein